MADRRIKDITVERTAPSTDDYFVADGVSGGTAKITALNLFRQDIGIPFVIHGGGSAITTGIKGDLEVPCNCDVMGWTLLADQSGSIVIDVWKSTFAAYPPVVGGTITGSEKPTLASVNKNQDTSLTSWNVILNKGDILRFNVDSATTVTRVTLNLLARRRLGP